MSEHRRTAIRTLSIRRYRSLGDVVLEDLPPIIVLYGPNGSGKSNILRAAQLVLRAAALRDALPTKREEATSLQLLEAALTLDLRPDDFRFGDLPEIHVSLSIDLGTRAREIVLPPSGRELSRLDLEAVFLLAGDGAIRFWFERAEIDGTLPIGAPADAAAYEMRRQIEGLRQRRDKNQVKHRDDSRRLKQVLSQSDDELRNLESALGDEFLIAERVQRVLIPRLLQASEAYRIPGGPEDPQGALYQAFLSEDPRERDAAHRLGQRLTRAGLFGAPAGGVAVLPIDSRTYAEKQIRFRHPTHGELPLRNLGSGELCYCTPRRSKIEEGGIGFYKSSICGA